MSLDLFHIVLMASILLCALVAGLVFGFASVVMPGLAKLPDRSFLLAFKSMDGIIQNNQPAFMMVWIGSVFSVIATTILGTLNLSGSQVYLLWFGSALYLLAVQLPTLRFNIPLNNALQTLDIESLSESELSRSRQNFEDPWNRWNRFRTLTSIFAVSVLILLQFQL